MKCTYIAFAPVWPLSVYTWSHSRLTVWGQHWADHFRCQCQWSEHSKGRTCPHWPTVCTEQLRLSHTTQSTGLLSNNPLSFHEWEAEQVVCCPDAVANQKACMGQSANHTDQNKICTEQKGPFSSFRFAAYCLFTCDVICRICPGLTFQSHYLVISMQFESAGDKNKIVHF